MNKDKNLLEISDLQKSISAPKPGEILFVLQVNPADKIGRQYDPATDVRYGEINPDEIDKTIDLAESNFNKIISDIPQNDRKNLKVIFFATGSELKEPQKPLGIGHHARGIEGSQLTKTGALKAIKSNKLSKNVLLSDTIYAPKSLNDAEITPEYEKLLMEKTGGGQSFWIAFEEDKFKDARLKLKAKSPKDRAELMGHYLTLVAHSFKYLFEENPNTRLVVHTTLFYDNLSPYLRHILDVPFMFMEKNSGVVMKYDIKQDAFIANVNGAQYQKQAGNLLSLRNKSNGM
jgi:hypothetical protein